MVTRITIVALLIAACGCTQEAREAPQREPARHDDSPMILISDVSGAVLTSTDRLPSFCHVEDKDCLKPDEMDMKPCKLGSDDCPRDGMIQKASAMDVEKL